MQADKARCRCSVCVVFFLSSLQSEQRIQSRAEAYLQHGVQSGRSLQPHVDKDVLRLGACSLHRMVMLIRLGTNSVALPSSVFSITFHFPLPFIVCFSVTRFVPPLFQPSAFSSIRLILSSKSLLAAPSASRRIVPVFLQTWKWQSALQGCCARKAQRNGYCFTHKRQKSEESHQCTFSLQEMLHLVYLLFLHLEVFLNPVYPSQMSHVVARGPPIVLPSVAARMQSAGLSPTLTNATITTSELNGRMLPASKAEKNKPG